MEFDIRRAVGAKISISATSLMAKNLVFLLSSAGLVLVLDRHVGDSSATPRSP